MDSGTLHPQPALIEPESSGSPSPHPSPMEDTDSFGTRKRPRLDSGERAYRSMSAERLHRASLQSASSQYELEKKGHSSPASLDRSKPPKTPTKVTINVRDPQPADDPPLTNTTNVEPFHMKDSELNPDPPPQPDSPKIMSLHSTPSGSPEIQIAEPEDVGQEPTVTRWRPLKDRVSEVKNIQARLMLDFPGVANYRSVLRALSCIILTLEKEDFADGCLLDQLADWIDDYLETTKDLPSYWWELLLAEREFWDEFPKVMEVLFRRGETNKSATPVLQIVSADRSHGEPDSLTRFLQAWSSLAMRMVEVDLQTLRDTLIDANTEPDLISDKYVQPIQYLMKLQHPFWRHVVDSIHYDNSVPILAIMTRLTGNSGKSISILTRAVTAILDRATSLPDLVPKIMAYLGLVGEMATHFRSSPYGINVPLSARISSQLNDGFSAIDSRLQSMISKQMPGLSFNVCSNIVQCLALILMGITNPDMEFMHRRCEEKGLNCEGASTEEKVDLLQLSWKFETFKNCIMEGRMEIRVYGVEAMQYELVQAHKKYNEGRRNGAETPVPLFLSRYLIDNKIIAYLLSAESHSQLINRAANILGFLVITGKLADGDTDLIWNALTTSQESRSSEGIMNMLVSCLQFCDRRILLYLVSKLASVSAHDFDLQMRHLAEEVFKQIGGKWRQARFEPDAKIDKSPFDLCIRLIRESAPDSSNHDENTRMLRDFALYHLSMLLYWGSDRYVKEAMFKECLDDIADRESTATGSISALTNLMGDRKADHIRQLSRDMDMINVLVEDLQTMVKRAKDGQIALSMSYDCLQIRLSLLEPVLIETPEIVDHKAAEALWKTLVGPDAIDDNARDIAWATFVRAARFSRSQNPFIDLCVSEFFMELHSRYLVSGCLSFADAVRHYLVQASTSSSRSPENEFRGPTASELLWHLSLSVPAGHAEMEAKAIDMLISVYLDSPDAHRRSREANATLHVESVDRCIAQLTKAASRLRGYSDGTSSGEDEPMIIVATDDEIEAQKTCFLRSLMILREFVRGVRSRPMYSPSPELPAKLPKDFGQLKGDPITIKYQTFAEGRKHGEISTFQVGGLETVNELSNRLSLLTGFSKLMMICGGGKIDIAGLGDQQLKDADFVGKGLMLIRKIPTVESSSPDSPLSGLRPMEMEVLRHFDELYQLLNMEEALARQVFGFLTAFPPHSSIIDLVTDPEKSVEDVFPYTVPFKVLYSAYALKHSLGQSIQDSIRPIPLIQNGIDKAVAAFTQLESHMRKDDYNVDLLVAGSLADCLSAFLKAARDPQRFTNGHDKKSSEAETAIIEEVSLPEQTAKELIDRCFTLLSDASLLRNKVEADNLVYATFSVVLDASMVSPSCWAALRGTQILSGLFKRLLLEDERRSNRQGILKIIKSAAQTSPRLSAPFLREFIAALSDASLDVISETPAFSDNTEQFFDVTHMLLLSEDQADQKRLDADKLATDWIALLVEHRHTEVVGRGEIDHFVLGLARLVLWCFQLAKSCGKQLQTSPNNLVDLFRSQLFPAIHDFGRMPNLCSTTREHLYSIVLALSQEENNFQTSLRLLQDLNTEHKADCQAWSWGIASIHEDSNLQEPNWHLEQAKAWRASTGYSGLRNLSNTCYMNSLFTQLFMNVSFRDFMVNVNIADGGSSQKLLNETRNLFGYMQDSSLKAVDSQNIADSIVTYDNAAVDVTHQVDVDEFFNLLFDRWESQILADDDKKKFRQFFGGQIVQQIKSKECPHISERLEPFSAIQCDIAGKRTLGESLNAYVQGEAMEGDNKYSCTSCSKYVDAVKRACFKDLPDNIIFHLKRFDYDLMTGTRTKINERFEFPLEIDMAPYKVGYLSDTSRPTMPDVFSLVGVLVHSGTAESGHYYSYIQERQRSIPYYRKWVEFNDMDVSDFNPADIDAQCFGGWQEMPAYDTRYPKLWNAYMLFYERTTTYSSPGPLQAEPSSPGSLRCALPDDLRTRISIDNQVFLRRICRYDPAHATFMREMLRQLRIVHGAQCSSGHDAENMAIDLALEFVANVLAHTRDTTQFEEMLVSLTRMIGTCRICCELAMRWVTIHDHSLHEMLLKCPHPKFRKDFAGMIVLNLQKLRQDPPASLANDISTAPRNTAAARVRRNVSSTSFSEILHSLIGRLRQLWELIPSSPRAWDDYFGLLAEIASMGALETHALLRFGYLQCCLELLMCEHPNTRSLRSQQPYGTYSRMIEKGRKFNYNKLVELVAILFERLDLRCGPTEASPQNRPFDHNSMLLTETEYEYIHFRHAGKQSICIYLNKAIAMAANPQAVKRIIRAMILAEPEARLHPLVYNTIKEGMSLDPASLAAPYLRAALAFCESTPTASQAERLISEIAVDVGTIEHSGGLDHLEFFQMARRLRSLRNLSPHLFHRCVLTNMYHWAPQLLIYWESEVRQRTVEFLKIILFDHDIANMDDEELSELLWENGRRLGRACAQRCKAVLEEGKPIGRTADEIMNVITACLNRYFTQEADEAFISEATDVMERVQVLTVTELDDQISEWANASELPTDSDSETFEVSP